MARKKRGKKRGTKRSHKRRGASRKRSRKGTIPDWLLKKRVHKLTALAKRRGVI